MALNITGVTNVLNFDIGQNTQQEYLIAIGIFIGALVVLKIFKEIVLFRLEKLSKKSKNIVDDIFISFIKQFDWPFLFFVAVFAGAKYLVLNNFLDNVLNYMFAILAVFYTAKGVNAIIDFIAKKEIREKRSGEEEGQVSLVVTLSRILKGIVWIIAFLLVLSNLGINVTSLIAGLGVGGIAIAFALQNILEDIFSSFSIYFDKPFEEGDFIIIGDGDMGVVEHIGIKTTRIRHLQGEELVVSNKELTSTRIHNYKKMERRRISFNFGVDYDTPPKKLEKIPDMITKIIESVELTELDRVHLESLGDSALNYEVVYYVDSSDYNKYMDIQQKINIEILKKFKKEKIDMPFPTRTVYLHK